MTVCADAALAPVNIRAPAAIAVVVQFIGWLLGNSTPKSNCLRATPVPRHTCDFVPGSAAVRVRLRVTAWMPKNGLQPGLDDARVAARCAARVTTGDDQRLRLAMMNSII